MLGYKICYQILFSILDIAVNIIAPDQVQVYESIQLTCQWSVSVKYFKIVTWFKEVNGAPHALYVASGESTVSSETNFVDRISASKDIDFTIEHSIWLFDVLSEDGKGSYYCSMGNLRRTSWSPYHTFKVVSKYDLFT